MGGAGYSIVGQNIYLAGTWNGGNGSTLHYRYDAVANTWTQMADVPVNIYRPDSAALAQTRILSVEATRPLALRSVHKPAS